MSDMLDELHSGDHSGSVLEKELKSIRMIGGTMYAGESLLQSNAY